MLVRVPAGITQWATRSAMRNIQATQQTLDDPDKRGIVVLGADVIAEGWRGMIQQAQLKLLADRMKSARKGILMPHDSDARTAALLPAFARYLRDNRDRLVHVVATVPAKAAADVQKREKRE
jgi:hypothetical protein